MTTPENTAAPIVIYQSADGSVTTEVKVQDETVWLTQAQMVALFGKTKQNISLHIRNIFKEGELREMSVVKESLTTAADGKQYKTQLYNLDVIISVGYRVKSSQGTQFRIWANRVLKDYLVQGYALNRQRLEAQQENIRQLERTLTLFQQNLIEQASLPEARGLVRHERNRNHRFQSLEFLHHVARRRRELWRLSGTTHLSDFPENGR